MTMHRLLARACTRAAFSTPNRSFAAKASPPFPTTPVCPAPSCPCAPTPDLPEDLPIDHRAPLNGLISNYAQHVLVCTGKDDWPSRIEEDNSGDNLAADLRELVGPKGKFNDPFHNISVLNSSFPSSPPPKRRPELQTSSVYILPHFKYVPFLPRVSFDSAEALVKGYLQPDTLHPMHDGLSPIHRDRLLRQPAYQSLLWGVRDVKEVVVLICGHGGRDRRCGIYGPVLRAEFEKRLPERGVEVSKGPVEVEGEEGAAAAVEGAASGREYAARVGLISHIGGHKFAGNVIVYMPPTLRTEDGLAHPLAGHGIWYGRVEPKHVEGIVGETILKGRVIKELFRGGIKQDGQILRLWPFAALLIFAAVVALADDAILSAQSPPKPLNQDTFVPFTIISREQVSPTAFLLTLGPAPPRSPGVDVIKRAWEHGLWSVEVKQPELQVARDYTPLPSSPSLVGEAGPVEGNGRLRLYIRRMEKGEVSGYLARLKVGDTVELRGPRLAFDVRRRVGKKVIFFAGGTGIAPALQAARALLDHPAVEMEVVWANRRREDCVGCDGGEKKGPVVAMMEELRTRYGERFRYSCTLDEEGSTSVRAGAGAAPVNLGIVKLVVSDDKDTPAGADGQRCQCKDGEGNPVKGGKNLLMFSGPDGFMAHYVGAKVWAGGKELQGPVKGAVGDLKRKYPSFGEDWLVLKM
ncbi:hypothetical protein N657DRAFT_661605 [Parathielavia appendiculata]|uniref:Altered inheritance of mitochondria protein 32 n=1 Tax=Parathielavia appendiculata TaxID=2587402 RepID=A0AAN6U7B4_9PEZI|nr:hypothetical protein N657DRAFT_661605 [Parathielavia appendiculata]